MSAVQPSHIRSDHDAPPPQPQPQARSKILVLGGKKVGKSCCVKMAFADLKPEDAIYVDMTTKIEKVNFDSVIPLQLIDTPGNFEISQLSSPAADLKWTDISTIVYVVDMLQLTNANDSILTFGPIFVAAYAQNPSINFEIFLHKGDALHVDNQEEAYQNFTRDGNDYFLEFDAINFFAPSAPSASTTPPLPPTSPSTPYHCPPFTLPPEQQDPFIDGLLSQFRVHLTSVWDFSIFEAWSKVVQKLMEGVYGPLEGLMNTLVQSSEMDKAFLFDINAKIYVAVDISYVESRTFLLCSDYLKRKTQIQGLFSEVAEARKSARKDKQKLEEHNGTNGTALDADEEEEEDLEAEERDWPFQVARIGDNSSIAYWEFSDKLALICKMRSDVLRSRKGMIEYNVTLLRQGVMQILDAVPA